MTIAVGERLPDATFKVFKDGKVEDVPLAEVVAGKRVVLFAVPGAFTPTCHLKHVPSFLERFDELRAKGVDTVACVAVNDPFVLDAWCKALGAEGRILMLADGNATFTRAIGLAFDGSALGLGTRSKRYAMLVEDGVVKALFVEDAPGQVEVSGADSILKAIG